jgi:hypothetical protein
MNPTAEVEPQSAAAVLMIRPAHFGSNAETAPSNFFQSATPASVEIAMAARREFDGLALALQAAGVQVHGYEGQAAASLPDEVFPNNWLSLHADGTAVLYPMLAPNRRRERRRELIADLHDTHGYRIRRIVDLTQLETRGEFLEGTGSLVLDRTQHIAYACHSPRTNAAALRAFEQALGYSVIAFRALDRAGRPIYHTNVMIALGARFAVACLEAMPEPGERAVVRAALEASGREVLEIGFAQLESFAGNLLELRGARGPVIALSRAALASLDAPIRRKLERHGELSAAAIDTIENVGGGSVRCMLCEVALPRDA